MDDNDIVELYWKRDERALQYSEKKYKAYCLKIADNILNNKEDSEECVNDALLVAWNEIPPKRPGSFRMFLARITRNGAINRLKSYTAQKRHGVEANMAIDEISKAYGLTGHAVSVILERARKKLRAHLLKEGYINEG